MTDRATRDWNTFGETEPYFAVLTHDRFLRERMSDADRDAFFASGEAAIAQILDLIDFAPKSALDFGCGVGRLTKALVKRVDRVAGIDAAESMLRIARDNVPDAAFSTTIPNERFDLIVSLLVFQHIPVPRGEALLDELLAHLADGGVAALHFTFRRPGSFLRRIARQIRGRVPLIHRIVGRIRRERPMPYMQMNEYRRDRVLAIFRRHGCGEPRMLPMNHDRVEGAIVIAVRGSQA
ncbi:MAG TPA: class I SAM-dependent methyltransferase [Thermoanaerobaculia bacterium]|jgi:SAM-dependent methyltransferase|nr:class I SAM-dependent methyltransferase [Thermoanaerobaculia bacterium]